MSNHLTGSSLLSPIGDDQIKSSSSSTIGDTQVGSSSSSTIGDHQIASSSSSTNGDIQIGSSSSSTIGDLDVESQNQTQRHAAHHTLVFSQAHISPAVRRYEYRGHGTCKDPYVVEFMTPFDGRNPTTWPTWKKWFITIIMSFAALAVTFVSSAYSGGILQIEEDFGASGELVTAGVSCFVLGFAIGPLLWAPLSELYGRQILFFITYAFLTLFIVGAAWAQNIQALVVLRFLAGVFGSSPLTNCGGVIADMFQAQERGLALAVFAAAPFLGPTIGPIVGGFVGQSVGWRWTEGVMAIFTGVVWLAGSLSIPETYSPVLLRRRAAKLSKATGKVYRSKLEIESGRKCFGEVFGTALSRPWKLLLVEPIVLLLSIFMAVMYGTLYMMFAAFPIVYQEKRGWSQGASSLSFIGIAVGMMLAVFYCLYDNKRYDKISEEADGKAIPEARLPPCLIGAVCLPVGLFGFAWTNSPSIHWSVSIIATAWFGFGMVLVFLAITNYLIDSYTIYAASVLAANSVLRSLFGAIFPLFTTQMYRNLGIHWASSIPAFLALACVPFPFLFYKYGEQIRLKCKYAAEAKKKMDELRGGRDFDDTSDGDARKSKADVERKTSE